MGKNKLKYGSPRSTAVTKAAMLVLVSTLSACGGVGSLGSLASDTGATGTSSLYPTGDQAAVTGDVSALYSAPNSSSINIPTSGTASYSGSTLFTTKQETNAQTADIMATGNFGMVADFAKSGVSATISGLKEYNGGTTPTAVAGSITGNGTISGNNIAIGSMTGTITPAGQSSETVKVSNSTGSFKQYNNNQIGGVSLAGTVNPTQPGDHTMYVYMAGTKQ